MFTRLMLFLGVFLVGFATTLAVFPPHHRVIAFIASSCVGPRPSLLAPQSPQLASFPYSSRGPALARAEHRLEEQ